jgi:hypothetical protein
MRIRVFTFMAAAIGLALSAPAQAKSLRTAPASEAFANAWLYCEIVNTGPTTAVVTIETRAYAGTLLDSYGPIELPGGQRLSWPRLLDGPAYCKFDIVAGSSKRLRAQAVYFEKGGGHPMVNVPAR